MARTLQDDEERLYRILFVGDYLLTTGKSIRQLANEISEWFFPISSATVHDYIQRYKELKPEDIKLVNQRIKANSEKTIMDPKVKRRVLTVADMFLEGFLVNEIAEKLRVSYWVVHYDLIHRLPKIDPIKFEEVKERLHGNSEVNLINHEK